MGGLRSTQQDAEGEGPAAAEFAQVAQPEPLRLGGDGLDRPTAATSGTRSHGSRPARRRPRERSRCRHQSACRKVPVTSWRHLPSRNDDTTSQCPRSVTAGAGRPGAAPRAPRHAERRYPSRLSGSECRRRELSARQLTRRRRQASSASARASDRDSMTGRARSFLIAPEVVAPCPNSLVDGTNTRALRLTIRR